jgi:hypothetical protein
MQSLSDREIVLPLKQSLEALTMLMNANWAVLGWEGWVKYPDGCHGHPPKGMPGVNIEQKKGETWIEYVHRSAHVCRITMEREQHAWNNDAEYTHLKLYFCLTAIPPGE